jgi:hypothetical protein
MHETTVTNNNNMHETTVTNRDLCVNAEDKRSTIIRVVHNRENPFVQLNKQALWDTNLSLKAVDGAMKELIDAGYAYRLEYSERGEDGKYKTSGVEYVFFEFPATQEEMDQQEEIFKKSFQHCRYGNSRKEHLLIQNPTETDLTKRNTTPPIPPQNNVYCAEGIKEKIPELLIPTSEQEYVLEQHKEVKNEQ